MSKKKPIPTAPAQKQSAPAEKADTIKVITDNKRARFEYEVLETLECGLALVGTEVKSMRQGLANLQDAHARIEAAKSGSTAAIFHLTTTAIALIMTRIERRMLLHKYEIRRLKAKVQEKGLALIPLKLYFKNNRAKIALGLCRGKKLHDKRDVMSKRDSQRQLERVVKSQRY